MEIYQQLFYTTLAFSFGILHLILFLYNRWSKSNLFFSIFLFLYALNIFFDYQAFIAAHENYLFNLRIHRAIAPYNPLLALLFLYYAFDFNIPKYFWYLTASIVITGFLAVINPLENYFFVQIFVAVVFAEVIRVLIKAIKNKKYDAWLIATGFILLILFSSYDLMMDLDLISSYAGIVNGYPVGFLCLIICASIYLARDFARANRTILLKEREARKMELNQKILEAEDQRKARELKEARDLQISLLPKCKSDLENYEFCFEMRPATEVGGDYYDYQVTGPGKISVVIGDATSHGMKAGIMVSIMKSLYLTHVNNMEIREFLNQCSKTIKEMKLKNLFMALMMVKINGQKLQVSSAGIPPLLIYRVKTGSIDEITLKGMPLGALESFPYQTADIKLNPGDTVILMTDGILELFNKEKEPLGLERVKEVFKNNSNEPVDRIVDKIFLAGDEWRADEKQNDDITLVTFRLKY